MTPPVLIVAGLGRCGTTAMMTALAVGGIPTAGEAPGFEPPETAAPVDPAWLAGQAGRAVKMLDPHRSRDAMRCDRVVLFLTRCLIEQAKSQIKMVAAFTGAPHPGRRGVRRVAAALVNDEWAALSATAPQAQRIRFEDMVRTPETTMGRVARVLRPWWSLDVLAATAAIKVRHPRCAPGLDMEISLAEAAEA